MSTNSYETETDDQSYLIGLFLAISSSAFIGSSFVLKKISLQRLSKSSSLRAGAGGFGYLKDWVWWAGLLSMGFGELMNLIAYGFAPASLVTPLGALSVLISAILASKYLQEHLTTQGKVGCVFCIIGSTLIILNAPKEVDPATVISVETLEKPVVVVYALFVVILSTLLISYVGPKYGTKYLLIYVLLCSQVGSFTVMASKVLALALRGEAEGENVGYQVFLISAAVLVICVCIQMVYLNKALDIFGATVVTPVYYVIFTTLVLFFSSILFDEWKQMTIYNSVETFVGLIIAFVAIFLLNAKKEKSGDFLLSSGDTYRYT